MTVPDVAPRHQACTRPEEEGRRFLRERRVGGNDS